MFREFYPVIVCKSKPQTTNFQLPWIDEVLSERDPSPMARTKQKTSLMVNECTAVNIWYSLLYELVTIKEKSFKIKDAEQKMNTRGNLNKFCVPYYTWKYVWDQ